MVKREEIIKHIKEYYGVSPEYLWKDTPDTAVFRHEYTHKWFAIIMKVKGE